MIFGSVCSGIEAASLAWEPLGWRAAFLSEIEPFPRMVLQHHWPSVPIHGDFTTIRADDYEPIDLLAGGTPCQSFSVAGKRAGLDDPRGNLTLEFLALAGRLGPRWLVWENVPGILSDDEGRTFGAVLGALGKLGYGFAYRVLDAQWFGVPQRRRRVFLVGYLGDWRPPAAVLFEPEGLRGDSPPRRGEGKDLARCLTHGSGGGHRYDAETETLIAHSLRGEGFDASEDGTGRGTPIVPVAIQERAVSENLKNGPQGKGWQDDIAYTLEARNKVQAVAFAENQRGELRESETVPSLNNGGGKPGQGYPAVNANGVRRIMPIEAERLQGLPDNHTRIPWRGKPAEQCPDGPRYRAIGNSWAVPVARWIGERIALCDEIVRAA